MKTKIENDSNCRDSLFCDQCIIFEWGDKAYILPKTIPNHIVRCEHPIGDYESMIEWVTSYRINLLCFRSTLMYPKYDIPSHSQQHPLNMYFVVNAIVAKQMSNIIMWVKLQSFHFILGNASATKKGQNAKLTL